MKKEKKEENKVICVFCEFDMSKQKFREDYTLLAWKDDPDEPNSLTKEARPAHHACIYRFVDNNFDKLRDELLEISRKANL